VKGSERFPEVQRVIKSGIASSVADVLGCFDIFFGALSLLDYVTQLNGRAGLCSRRRIQNGCTRGRRASAEAEES
jgi:hypothetical protein